MAIQAVTASAIIANDSAGSASALF